MHEQNPESDMARLIRRMEQVMRDAEAAAQSRRRKVYAKADAEHLAKLRSVRPRVEALGLKLERHRCPLESGERGYAIIDPWAKQQPYATDRADGYPDRAYVLRQVSVEQVKIWADQYVPMHELGKHNFENMFRQSIGLPTLEELGWEFPGLPARD